MSSECLLPAGHVGRVIATTFESLEVLRERYEDALLTSQVHIPTKGRVHSVYIRGFQSAG